MISLLTAPIGYKAEIISVERIFQLEWKKKPQIGPSMYARWYSEIDVGKRNSWGTIIIMIRSERQDEDETVKKEKKESRMCGWKERSKLDHKCDFRWFSIKIRMLHVLLCCILLCKKKEERKKPTKNNVNQLLTRECNRKIAVEIRWDDSRLASRDHLFKRTRTSFIHHQSHVMYVAQKWDAPMISETGRENDTL